MTVSSDDFARVLPTWYERYKLSHYFDGYRDLLVSLPLKAARCGCLDIEDLCLIADWGGNQHGVKQQLVRNNSPSYAQAKTGEAFRFIQNPARALEAVLGLKNWGLTYGSKTLMFMKPSEYGALDGARMRPALNQVLPPIRDGDRNSMVRGYVEFLNFCRRLRSTIEELSPRQLDKWLLADIQSAVFQFTFEGGVILK